MSDFKAKMHQIRFWLGLRPRPRWGSLQRSPRSLAAFDGPTTKGGRGGKRGGDEREGEEGEGRKRGGEREGRGEEAFLVMWPRRLSVLNPPLVTAEALPYNFQVIYSTVLELPMEAG